MTENERAVHKALITVCQEEACATVLDIVPLVRMGRDEITTSLRALVKSGKACTLTDVDKWSNPIDEHGRPLVCGVWNG